MIKYIDIGKEENLKICIIGDEIIQSIIETYVDKKTSNKVSSVKGFNKADNEIQQCDFVYISSSNPGLSSSTIGLASAASHPLVTISDIDDFIKKSGGMVEIYEVNGRIRFSLNLKKAKFDNIKINSKLIETANKIY